MHEEYNLITPCYRAWLIKFHLPSRKGAALLANAKRSHSDFKFALSKNVKLETTIDCYLRPPEYYVRTRVFKCAKGAIYLPFNST